MNAERQDEAATAFQPCYIGGMKVRTGEKEEEITAAIRIDAGSAGTDTRAPYIAAVADRGGLRLIEDQGRTVGFCCLDDRYFFGKAFISLLMVEPGARRRGIGRKLLDAAALEHAETWTSTNRSNMAMRGLLSKTGWLFCGQIEGLDAGDPELVYKTAHCARD